MFDKIVKVDSQILSNREILKNRPDETEISKIKTQQINHINQKVELEQQVYSVYINRTTHDDKLREYYFRIEQLQDKLIEQKDNGFSFMEVDTDLVDKIMKPLIKKEVNQLDNQHEKVVANRRANEKQLNLKIFKDFRETSLIKIHLELEKERIRIENEEKERKRIEKYNRLLERAGKLIINYEFLKARNSYEKAITTYPEFKGDIFLLIKKLDVQEKEYKIKKEQFSKMLVTADNYLKNNQFEKAIENYKKALKYEIDNKYCNTKIIQAEDKRKKQIEIEKRKIEFEEKERKLAEKYKKDHEEILSFLRSKNINQLYHYTDERNLYSIMINKGLLSLNQLNKLGISFTRGSETSELPDYVRLSYVSRHPLRYVSENEGRILKSRILEIDLKAAILINSMYTNVNAARTSREPKVKYGDDIQFLRSEIHYGVFNKSYFHLSESDQAYYQAEVMVKDKIDLDLILNLKSELNVE